MNLKTLFPSYYSYLASPAIFSQTGSPFELPFVSMDSWRREKNFGMLGRAIGDGRKFAVKPVGPARACPELRLLL